jgi:putative peptidoglycan lipid II flippase
LPALMLVKVLAPGFYARQDTKTPMRIGLWAMLANLSVSLLLFYPLGHIGLAIAVTVGAFVNAGLLFWRLYQDKVFRPQPGWAVFLGQVMLASIAMGVVLYIGVGKFDTWLQAHAWARVGRLALWVAVGLLVYVSVGLAVGLRPRQMLLAKGESIRHDD